jgi:hypothetical protein
MTRAAGYTPGPRHSRRSWRPIETVRTLSQKLSSEKGWV